MKRITIRDVAEKAGTSINTVSRALNDKCDVKASTKERILKAAAELNHAPNSTAKHLRTGRSSVLGFITDDISNLAMISSDFVHGIQDAAYEDSFSVLISDFQRDPERELRYLEILKHQRVAGVIFCSSRLRESSHKELQEMGVPFVYLHGYAATDQTDSIVPDNEQGGFTATRHLLGLGRREIAFVAGKNSFQSSCDRRKGYENALESYGLAPQPQLIVGGDGWGKASGSAAARELIERDAEFDALFCASDMLAAGAMATLQDSGYSIPDSISVVGFDDREFAQYVRPALTTVALPVYEMGVVATKKLISKVIGDEAEPAVTKVKCDLVVRASCGAAGKRQGGA